MELCHPVIPLDQAIINDLPEKLYARPSQGSVAWWLIHKSKLPFSAIYMLT
jgi:hypothetical protein